MHQQARSFHRSEDWANIEFAVHSHERLDGRGGGAGSLVSGPKFAEARISGETGRETGDACASPPILVYQLVEVVGRRRNSPARAFSQGVIKHDAPRTAWHSGRKQIS